MIARVALLRYDKHGNLLETIQKPAAIRRALVTLLSCAQLMDVCSSCLVRFTYGHSIYRLDSYDPATGAWQRMRDPPIQGFGLNNGAAAHAGKLYAIGGNVYAGA